MTSLWANTLVSVFVISGISLLCALSLALRTETMHKIIPPLIGLAVGALYGDALIHLLPESFAKEAANKSSSLKISQLVLCGLLMSFFFERAVRSHRGTKQHTARASARPGTIHPAAFINLLGSSIHNFVDGALVGASYLAGPSIGLATTIAVILHEIPHELGDFGILVNSGFTVRTAVFLNFVSALFAFGGAVGALMLGSRIHGFAEVMIPFTAGTFLYLAGTDLFPELLRPADAGSVGVNSIALLIGVGLMIAVAVFGTV